VLLDLGVPEHIKGHRYLVHAICLVVQKPELLEQITKELYPAVAQAFDATPGRVERAIRHAIELALERCDLDTFSRYFGNTVSPDRGKPMNREFIARISNVVRQYGNGSTV
jgi:two-component system response regulator (stage 0 sporulation protein A)